MNRWITVSALASLIIAGLSYGQVMTKEAQAAMAPAKALSMLKDGNERFARGKSRRRNYTAKVAATAAGQYPFAAIVSCMDSRAPVEIVFDQGIGDLFSLRVAGNVVDEDFLGSLEYAVEVVGVKQVVVLGHSECGAVKGAVDDVKLGNLTGLLAKIRPAVQAAGGTGTSKDKAFVAKVAEQNVRIGMKTIREKSPLLAKAIDSGKIGLAGGIYDISTGRVTFLAN
jgi:carbonic anhydrase